MAEQNQQGKSWEQQLHEAGVQFEQEVRRVVQFLDAEVVPEIRRHGSTALRNAAVKLQQFADHMDQQASSQTPGANGPTEPR